METREVSSSAPDVPASAARPLLSSGTVLRALLREGLAQPRAAIKAGGGSLTGEIDWPAVCTVAHQTRIAPIVYECLRTAAVRVPADVMDWFRVQHYNTVARNLASVNELQSVLRVLLSAGIPAIVLKGPALAQLSFGMARNWNDLDVLVRRDAIERVEGLLLQAGYRSLPIPPHPYHRRYGGGRDLRQSLVEIHYGISDAMLPYRPDLEGIWARADEAQILGVCARVPEIMDHLLLTIMQLPHHHWALRLLLDIWQMIVRGREAIDWPEFFRRADAWQMMALTRSALFVVNTTFGAYLPGGVISKVRSAGYYDRLRCEVVRSAINEQLEFPFRPRVTWIVPFVGVDRPGAIPGIVWRRLLGRGSTMEDGRMQTAVRRNKKSLSVLPALFRVLAASLPRSPGDQQRD